MDDFAAEALARMQQRNITQLVVTEDGQFAGFIHLHDLLREGLVRCVTCRGSAQVLGTASRLAFLNSFIVQCLLSN